MKEKDIKSKSLKQLIIDSQLKEEAKNNNNKLRDNFVNKPLEKNLNKMNPNAIIPQSKVKMNYLLF